MKLYKEEDMIRMYNFGYGTSLTGYGDADIALQKITPIELPNDEEIEDKLPNHIDRGYENGFYDGVEWILEQIKQQVIP